MGTRPAVTTSAPDSTRTPGAQIPRTPGWAPRGLRGAAAALPGAEESAGTKFGKGLIGELARLHGWEKG